LLKILWEKLPLFFKKNHKVQLIRLDFANPKSHKSINLEVKKINKYSVLGIRNCKIFTISEITLLYSHKSLFFN